MIHIWRPLWVEGEVRPKWDVIESRGVGGVASVLDVQSLFFLLEKIGLHHDQVSCWVKNWFIYWLWQWSHSLVIPLYFLWAKSNNRTRSQFECNVNWFCFCFDFICSHAWRGCWFLVGCRGGKVQGGFV